MSELLSQCLDPKCGITKPGGMQEDVCESCKGSVVDSLGVRLSVGSRVLCHFTESGTKPGVVIGPLVFHRMTDESGWMVWVQLEEDGKGYTVPSSIIERKLEGQERGEG